MGFETWLDKRRRQPGIISQQEIWDAATYAANSRAGDAANEAEKDARCKAAIEALLIESAYDLDPERIRAIIKIAQG